MTVLVPRRCILRPQLSIPRLNFRRFGDPSFNRLGIRGQPWGCGGLFPRVAAAAGIEDDFSGDLSKWTEIFQDWSIIGGVLRVTPATGVRGIIRYTDESTSTADQWVKMDLTAIGDSLAMGPAFRVPASGTLYYLAPWSDGQVYWQTVDTDGENVNTQGNGALAFSSGDVIGASITGTGTDTVVKVWKDPAGANPGAWGAADLTLTNDPGNPVNSGTEVGAVAVGNAGGDDCDADNYTGGDV